MIHPSPPAEHPRRGEGDSATFCVTSPEEVAEVSVIPLPTTRRPVALDPGRRLERREVTRTRDKAIPRAGWNGCSPTTATRCASGRFGGCSTRPAPGPRRSSASTCPTSTWSSGAPWSSRRAAIARTCTGRPRPPGCWPAAPSGRCSSPTGASALGDIYPETGRGRLSYPRAEYLFKQASQLHHPHGAGYTLHQLRHSGLIHLAAKGRSAAELQAKSRRHLATLGIYVRLGEETSARITAENDEHHRRHRR